MSPLLIVDRDRLRALARVRRLHAVLLLAAGAVGGYWISAQEPTLTLLPSASAATPVAIDSNPGTKTAPWCQDRGTSLRLSCDLQQ